ncbi:MAG: radical SAM protein [Planctomycetes bacterium]|nr:radical SAM protein [Planctomycetota bacterium]
MRKLRKELSRWMFLRRLAHKSCPFSRSPFTVSLNLTSRCNLRCKMCGQHGETGIYTGTDRTRAPHTLEFDLLRGVIDEIAAYPTRPDVCMWGGEPLLHPQFAQLLALIMDRRLFCVVETNGTLLERFAEEIVRSNVNSVNVSILGPHEIHDSICRVPGAFDRLSRGVRRIVRERRRLRHSRSLLKVVCTITPDNYTHLTEVAELVQDFGADVLIFPLGWFTTEALGRATDRLYQRAFDCRCTSWQGFAREEHGFDLDRLRDQIRSLYEMDTGDLYIKFSPSLPLDQMAEYYEKPSKLIGRRYCLFPWMLVDIRPNGDVVPCPDHPDYVIGNIKRQALLTIWNGPRMRKFRAELSRRGSFPICSRCCGMFT